MYHDCRFGANLVAWAVASRASHLHLGRMGPRHSPLDEPKVSSHAWAHYKRMMLGMGAFTIVVLLVALGVLYASGALVSIHFVIATVLGVGFTMMLMAALMGLVFLSSGTGHDESVSDLINDDD